MLKTYLQTFLSKRRYQKGASLFSIWDKASKISPKTYLAPGARITSSTVGNYSRLRHFCTIHFTSMGKFSVIGKGSRIGLGRHPLNLISTNLIFYKKNQIRNDWAKGIVFEEYKKIHIGSDVWIGENSTVMGGVTIGDGAVVAARSVVTKDVPPYAIVAGIPAKVVKYRFDKITIDKLLEIEWWNLPDHLIEEKLKAFTIFDINHDILKEYFG